VLSVQLAESIWLYHERMMAIAIRQWPAGSVEASFHIYCTGACGDVSGTIGEDGMSDDRRSRGSITHQIARSFCRFPHQLCAEILVLTNAAGSVRPEVGPGRLMMITDHINLTGVNVLSGPNDDSIGPRFPSLRDAYDPELRDRLRAAAGELGTDLAEGVYLAVSGPTFETPAEIRAFMQLGADAIGMSTVHETAVARHCGLRVAAISAISNFAEGLSPEPLSHEQTLRDAERAAQELAALLVRFLEDLGP